MRSPVGWPDGIFEGVGGELGERPGGAEGGLEVGGAGGVGFCGQAAGARSATASANSSDSYEKGFKSTCA